MKKKSREKGDLIAIIESSRWVIRIISAINDSNADDSVLNAAFNRSKEFKSGRKKNRILRKIIDSPSVTSNILVDVIGSINIYPETIIAAIQKKSNKEVLEAAINKGNNFSYDDSATSHIFVDGIDSTNSHPEMITSMAETMQRRVVQAAAIEKSKKFYYADIANQIYSVVIDKCESLDILATVIGTSNINFSNIIYAIDKIEEFFSTGEDVKNNEALIAAIKKSGEFYDKEKTNQILKKVIASPGVTSDILVDVINASNVSVETIIAAIDSPVADEAVLAAAIMKSVDISETDSSQIKAAVENKRQTLLSSKQTSKNPYSYCGNINEPVNISESELESFGSGPYSIKPTSTRKK